MGQMGGRIWRRITKTSGRLYRTGRVESFVLVLGVLELVAGALVEATGTGLDAIGSWTEYIPPPRDVQFNKLLIPNPG